MPRKSITIPKKRIHLGRTNPNKFRELIFVIYNFLMATTGSDIVYLFLFNSESVA